MLSLFVWNWIDKDVEIRRYVRVIENATSIKKVQQLWDNAYLVGGCHPFKSIYDYRYVYEGKLAELKKAEKEAESKAAAEAEIANTSQPQEKHPNPKRNIPIPKPKPIPKQKQLLNRIIGND